MIKVDYTPAGPTLLAFQRSNKRVRGLRGPFGSGKSYTCCAEIGRRAAEQKPSPNGKRRTRCAVIRNSYPELKTTTIKTWHELYPEALGVWTWASPPIHRIETHDLDMEVFFVSLDRPRDIHKILSMELTFAWINEAREMPKVIFDALDARINRFPPRKEGGATWAGIIMDTNPPDTDHWWYRLAEEKTPEDWEFFAQPPGDGPQAENIQNLSPDYYTKLKQGKSQEWINVYIKGNYGFIQEGKPVYPEFVPHLHTASQELEPTIALPLFVGLDFGLTPAAVIGQRTARGQWLILDELVTEDMGAKRFSELLAMKLADRGWHGDWEITAHADPAGKERAQTDEQTCIDIVREFTSLKVEPAPSQNPTERKESVKAPLSRLIDGRPGLVVNKRCKTLIKGLSGQYHYRRMQIIGEERYRDVPEKNIYSHVCEALEYMLMGAGEWEIIMRQVERRHDLMVNRQVVAETAYNPFGG